MREITDEALELIKRNEGLRLTAYRDVAGVWTIGYGHTPAYPGQKISMEVATELLRKDIGWAKNAVEQATLGVPTTDEQFSAMVSLTFNIGAAGFRRSTVLDEHRKQNYEAAADAFLMWRKARVNGVLQDVAGLLRRRHEERDIYLSEPAATAAPSPAPETPSDPLPATPVAETVSTPYTAFQRLLAAIGSFWK